MNGTTLLTAIMNATTNRPHDHDHDHEHHHDHDHGHEHIHDHDHDHLPHDYANENITAIDENDYQIIVAKGTAMLVLFSASMIFGLIPFRLAKTFKWTDPQKDARTNFVVSTLLSFGGGVLLCTTFLHLLPEISENIRYLQSKDELPHFEFSLAELLMGCGFFIIFFVEELVHMYLNNYEKKKSDSTNAFIRGRTPRESLRMRKEKIDTINETADQSTTVSTIDLVINDHHNHNAHPDSHVDHDHHRNSHPIGHSHEHHSHLTSILKNKDDTIVVSIRGLLIVLALSVHELFEGLAVGLESSTSNVWLMFGAVAAHKLVIAFCIGVELMVNRTRTSLGVFYVFLFAIVSPMGIGLGILISSGDGSATFEVASVILQGLASGTLLYVIFFEILSKHRSGFMTQYLAVLIGFFLMFGLKFIAGHTHSHGGAAEENHDHVHGHQHDHNDDHHH